MNIRWRGGRHLPTHNVIFAGSTQKPTAFKPLCGWPSAWPRSWRWRVWPGRGRRAKCCGAARSWLWAVVRPAAGAFGSGRRARGRRPRASPRRLASLIDLAGPSCPALFSCWTPCPPHDPARRAELLIRAPMHHGRSRVCGDRHSPMVRRGVPCSLGEIPRKQRDWPCTRSTACPHRWWHALVARVVPAIGLGCARVRPLNDLPTSICRPAGTTMPRICSWPLSAAAVARSTDVAAHPGGSCSSG